MGFKPEGAVRLEVAPVTLREARAFVARHHRHHRPPQGGLFALAAVAAGEVIGVAIVGRPVSRVLAADDYAAEVTRLCALPGHKNVCSFLYGAAWRACRALGYTSLVTYTLDSEPGTSLRAAGWRVVAAVRGRSWSCKSRPRVDTHPLQGKLRWEIAS